MTMQQILESEEEKLASAVTPQEKLNFTNNIFEIKKAINKEDVSLFSDAKKILKLYIEIVEIEPFGYYTLNKKNVVDKVKIFDVEKQINILNYLQRLLKINGFDDENNWVKQLIKKVKINKYKKVSNLSDFLYLIYHCVTYNIITLLLSIVMIYIIYSVILLPTNDPAFVLFNSTFVEYDHNKLINHFLNTLISFCSIDSEFKLKPINTLGVILNVFIKITLIVFILGYLSEEIKNKLK